MPWEVVLNVEDLLLGRSDIVKIRCLRDVGFQQLPYAPVLRSQTTYGNFSG
jgi:hypothetical protein